MFAGTMELRIFDKSFRIPESYRDPGILFVLRGGALVTVGNEKASLDVTDFLVINSYEHFTVETKEESLIGAVLISYAGNASYLDLSHFDIRCGSGMQDREVRERIRRRLMRIFSSYGQLEKEEAAPAAAAFYELLYDLRMNCMVPKSGSKKGGSRSGVPAETTIRRYLEEHYQEKICLRDLSAETYFSEAYLSRFIKERFGKNFGKLLADIRLTHARQLLGMQDMTILHAALESGFADTAALNRAFMSEYGITPSEYRRNENQHRMEQDPDKQEEISVLDRKIRDFFQEKGSDFRTEEAGVQRLFADAGHFRRLTPFWSKMINGGKASDIMRADVQMQILHLSREIGFKYVRIWDLWSPEVLIYSGEGNGSYNFSVLDGIIAFLYDNHLCPYFELGFKPLQINVDYYRSIVYEERRRPFETIEAFSDCMEEMLRHYEWLYGHSYVESWYLELWMGVEETDCAVYLDNFDLVFNRLKAVFPGIRIGGAGTNREKRSMFEELIRLWSRRINRPDFISVYLYPFDNGFLRAYSDSPGESLWKTDDYTVLFLDKVRQILNENDFPVRELHVSEWNFTPGNRDLINDSTFKGAYVVRSLMDMIDRADLAGYWPGLDLVSGYYDTKHLLDGRGGLLTRDNICKPAFYGFAFFSQLDPYLLARDANMIITSNRRGSYRIVCHNYQHPGQSYYDALEKQDGGIQAFDDAFIYENRQFRFVIRNVENGLYYVKKRLLDRRHGCVQNEWKQMGMSDALNVRDIEYLQGICVPQITMETVLAQKRELSVDFSLETNAILSIHIFPLGK